MDSVKLQFHQELEKLRKLIRYYEAENSLLSYNGSSVRTKALQILNELSTQFKAFSITKRTLNYNGLIISLYGFFENFIEQTILTYINDLPIVVTQFINLPESIKENHYKLSVQILPKIDQPKFAGALIKETIIENLDKSFKNHSPYRLNNEAFSYHTSNFRSDLINNIFNQSGVYDLNKKIINDSSFYNYIIQLFNLNAGDKINLEAFQIINDLAARRNEVAHGAASPLLNNNILIDYLNYFEFYSSALSKVMEDQILHITIKEKGKDLGGVIDKYQHGKVIIVQSKNNKVKTGMTIIARNSKEIIKTQIIGIQLNSKERKIIPSNGDYEIGLLLSIPLKSTHKIYLIC